MPKRVIALMVLAVLTGVMAATKVTAMAANGYGDSAKKGSISTISTTSSTTSPVLTSTTTRPRSNSRAWHWWRGRLLAYKKETWRRETLMGEPRTWFSRRLAHAGLATLIRYTIHWKAVARHVLYEFRRPPLLRDWLCIHHYEGAWNDPNAPYWGGLQMDYTFQSVYGPWLLKHEGTANHWTPMEQIWTALKAWRVRGFEPWANTAHACGLY